MGQLLAREAGDTRQVAMSKGTAHMSSASLMGSITNRGERSWAITELGG